MCRWSEARNVLERAACSACWPGTAAHWSGGEPEPGPPSPSAAHWEPDGAETVPACKQHTNTIQCIHKSVIKNSKSKNKMTNQCFYYLSFFLSPFFSMNPHTSAQVSMFVRKSSIVYNEYNIVFTFYPSYKATIWWCNWQGTYLLCHSGSCAASWEALWSRLTVCPKSSLWPEATHQTHWRWTTPK